MKYIATRCSQNGREVMSRDEGRLYIYKVEKCTVTTCFSLLRRREPQFWNLLLPVLFGGASEVELWRRKWSEDSPRLAPRCRRPCRPGCCLLVRLSRQWGPTRGSVGALDRGFDVGARVPGRSSQNSLAEGRASESKKKSTRRWLVEVKGRKSIRNHSSAMGLLSACQRVWTKLYYV
jgi:hypothetical protein